ncbi:MAG: universal stress protein [Ectothiorhodospiraceae bacterium]|jgi:universal stress protein A
MEAYRHILIAVDFQPDSDRVAQRALGLAEKYEARLSLLHVVENMPVEPGNELMIPPATSVESELLENAERRLRELADRLGVPRAQHTVAVGHTKYEILDFAREQEVDLIVVGSHGRHGLALLLGSTANAVLHGAPCDVLAVRI